MNPITTLALLIWMAVSAESGNILAVLPGPSKSHHYMFHPIIRELANRGHKITFISPYSLGKNINNVEEIIVKTSGQNFLDTVKFEELLAIGDSPIFIPPRMSFWFFGLMICEDSLSDPQVQKLIHSKERKYELILLETFFGQESFMGFSHRFQAPVITLNSQISYLFNDEFSGNPLAVSYIPHLELPLSSPMSFYERLINTIRSFVILLNGYFYYLPEHEIIMRKYFNYTDSDNIPPLVEMLRHNISLTIVNSQIGLDYNRPFMPNVIGAAGLHIKNTTEPLPQDIKQFMDKSTEGVVYFSLGTIVPTQRMPPEYKAAFINAFGKLKQNVLWKANVDTMDGIPSNVKVVKWVPQQSVLAHPNCKAFMTHGGLLSHQETVYFGVPQIGLPIFCDQHLNVARAASFGFGLKLDFKNLTEESIFWAINEVTNNKMYDEAAKRYSKIVRDNPVPPLENAIYWIEYVLRHKGAPHLQNTAKQNLSYFQYLLLDVILFMIVIVLTTTYSLYFLLRLLFTKYLKGDSVNISKNKSD